MNHCYESRSVAVIGGIGIVCSKGVCDDMRKDSIVVTI